MFEGEGHYILDVYFALGVYSFYFASSNIPMYVWIATFLFLNFQVVATKIQRVRMPTDQVLLHLYLFLLGVAISAAALLVAIFRAWQRGAIGLELTFVTCFFFLGIIYASCAFEYFLVRREEDDDLRRQG